MARTLAEAIKLFIETESVETGNAEDGYQFLPVTELYADEIPVDTLVAFIESEGITWGAT